MYFKMLLLCEFYTKYDIESFSQIVFCTTMPCERVASSITVK